MELNAEINKVFGQEMAKLFSNTITEEELREQAEKAWKEIRKETEANPYMGYTRKDSELMKEIKKALLKRIETEVNCILDSEEGKAEVRQTAERIVREIRKESAKKIVDTISDQIAMISSGYHGYGLKNYISNTIEEMLGRR